MTAKPPKKLTESQIKALLDELETAQTYLDSAFNSAKDLGKKLDKDILASISDSANNCQSAINELSEILDELSEEDA